MKYEQEEQFRRAAFKAWLSLEMLARELGAGPGVYEVIPRPWPRVLVDLLRAAVPDIHDLEHPHAAGDISGTRESRALGSIQRVLESVRSSHRVAEYIRYANRDDAVHRASTLWDELSVIEKMTADVDRFRAEQQNLPVRKIGETDAEFRDRLRQIFGFVAKEAIETPPTGIERVAEERLRQVEVEGFTPEGDVNGYDSNELVRAAVCYALGTDQGFDSDGKPMRWPWSRQWWKPTDRIQDLTKAAALLVAEIDRLQALANAE